MLSAYPIVCPQAICNGCTHRRAWARKAVAFYKSGRPKEYRAFCDYYPDGGGIPEERMKNNKLLITDDESRQICEHFNNGPVQWSPRQKSTIV